MLNILFILLAITPLIINILLIAKVKKIRQQVTSHHTKTLALLAFLRQQQSKKARLRNKQARVEKTVNTSTIAVESIHQSISDVAFSAFQNLSPSEKSKARSEKLKNLHDQTSSDVYKSVKVVNKQVSAITDALLSSRKQSTTVHNINKKDLTEKRRRPRSTKR